MFLIDTNCWIQLVRQRSQSSEVGQLLSAVPSDRLFVSIYSVHSIGVIMLRHGMIDQYAAFLSRSFIGTLTQIVAVPPLDLGKVADACTTHRMDFDDAYQYVAAELNALTLVSLDSDFDRTPRGRLTPAAALQRFTDEQKQQQP